jgi:hypothetical protein
MENLTYSYTRGNTAPGDMAALGARYGFDPASVDSTITLSIPSEYLSTWLIGPRQVTNRFYWTYTAISARLQQMLRAWLRFQWFADLANFNDLVASRAAIMYWLSAPHKGKARSEFTYDVLSPESVKKLCRVGPRKFAKELDIIHDRLRAAGKDQAADCYRRLHTREIMDAVKRERRTIARMIVIEAELVDILINFAVSAREQGQLKHELTSEVLRALGVSLRRFPVRGAEHDLAMLTLIEATAQLRRSLGLPGEIGASLLQ